MASAAKQMPSHTAAHGGSGSPVAVAGLVEQLMRNLSPRSSPATLQYCMRVLGSLIGPSTAPDAAATALTIEKALVAQGGDFRRFQELKRHLLGSQLLKQKESILRLLFLLHEQRHAGLGGAPGLAQPLRLMERSRVEDTVRPSPRDADVVETKSTVATVAPVRQPAMSQQISEALLVRDMLFVFQGVNGTYVKYSPEKDMFFVPPEVGISRGTRAIITQLSELGWLYLRVDAFMKRQAANPASGLCVQAFCSGLHEEISEYFKLLAVLEGQLRTSTTLAGQRPSAVQSSADLTLRRLLVWTQDPLNRMRLLASLAEGVEGLRGGALATAVHRFSLSGDPFVKELAFNLLQKLCAPLFHMIERWVVEGELEGSDTWREFFIACDTTVEGARLWQDKYSLRVDMVPSFIDDTLARQILQIGKSINFIRHVCNDKEWVMDAVGTYLGTHSLQFGDLERLHTVVAQAAEATNKHLITILFQRFSLLEHCAALKRYVLLGQGDFVQYLMMKLGPLLDEQARKQAHHQLVGVMDAAMRSSNAQFERKDILERLDIKLMEASEGETGWDIFALEYRLDPVLSAIIPPAAVAKYLQIFNFLWRLKRVEYSLCNTWRHHMNASHSVEDVFDLQSAFHMCHLLRNEMMHMVATLANYVMFEVLETSWAKLVQDMNAAKDMDGLIAAHDSYLDMIFDKSLLSSRGTSIAEPLKRMMSDILDFVQLQDNLYTNTQTELAVIRRCRSAAAQRTAAGQWGLSNDDESMIISAQTHLASLGDRAVADVSRLSKTFQERVLDIVRVLQANESRYEEFRFLIFRIDFNEFYTHLADSNAAQAAGAAAGGADSA